MTEKRTSNKPKALDRRAGVAGLLGLRFEHRGDHPEPDTYVYTRCVEGEMQQRFGMDRRGKLLFGNEYLSPAEFVVLVLWGALWAALDTSDDKDHD